ncbi:MAG: hypothetical protein HDKAJFGB_03639 [Anaerolineae bacterium]|nr:hypothetical protein [Anaerolineae bacterium]
MIRVSNGIIIARTLDDVFQYVADYNNNPYWMPVQSVQPVTVGPIQTGTKFKQQFQLMGSAYEMDCLIREFEPGKKITFEYVAPVFIWNGMVLFKPNGAGTHVQAQGNVTLSGTLRLTETLVAPKVRNLINNTAPKLKQVLES